MQVTLKAFVTYHKYHWEDKPEYSLRAYDMSDQGPDYAVIGQQEFTVDIPDDFDPRPQQISALKAKRQEVLAEAQVKANNIDEQIQALLAIDDKSEQPA